MNKFLYVPFALVTLVALTAAAAAQAKLPPPTPEAAAAAAEAKEKAAWGDKVAAYKLCLAQNKTVEYYEKTKGAKKSSIETPPCTDPGPFKPSQTAQAEAKPAEAAKK